MTEPARRKTSQCQLQVIYDAGEELTLVDRARNKALRLLSALRRRLKRMEPIPGVGAGQPGIGVIEESEPES